MNETFFITFGWVCALVAGVVMLTLFFMVVGRINRKFAPSGIIKFKGLLEEQRPVDVVLENGERLTGVKLVGFTESNPGKGQPMPYQLNHLAVFQKPDGARLFIRPDSIKYLEEKAA